MAVSSATEMDRKWNDNETEMEREWYGNVKNHPNELLLKYLYCYFFKDFDFQIQ